MPTYGKYSAHIKWNCASLAYKNNIMYRQFVLVALQFIASSHAAICRCVWSIVLSIHQVVCIVYGIFFCFGDYDIRRCLGKSLAGGGEATEFFYFRHNYRYSMSYVYWQFAIGDAWLRSLSSKWTENSMSACIQEYVKWLRGGYSNLL